MEFRCEDLRDFGLVLVPPTSPGYDPLLADIQRRIDNPPRSPGIMPEQLRRMMFGRIDPEERATSAILLNQSERPIAALALVWRYEYADGSAGTRSSTRIFGRHVLLPFSLLPLNLKLQTYWNTILPGSKRYLGEDGMAGGNTDVRMPEPDEIWKGGGGMGGGSGVRPWVPVEAVTFAIDGAFFSDGEFIGANRHGLWENMTFEAETRMDIARTAREGRNRGIQAVDIFEEIETITGPAEPIRAHGRRRPGHPQMALQSCAREIERQRRSIGDDATIERLASLADTPLPDFRKR